jgi:hypothetical protein
MEQICSQNTIRFHNCKASAYLQETELPELQEEKKNAILLYPS